MPRYDINDELQEKVDEQRYEEIDDKDVIRIIGSQVLGASETIRVGELDNAAMILEDLGFFIEDWYDEHDDED